MRRVQKAAAALAALALTTALAVPVWAEEKTKNIYSIDEGNNQAICPVTATYMPTPVYHVDIEWGSMAFEYTAGTWMGTNSSNHDANENLSYVAGENETVGWNNGLRNDQNHDHNTIKIVNRSNVDVGLKLLFEAAAPNDNGRVVGDFYATDDSTSHQKIQDIKMERADKYIDGTVKGANATAVGKNNAVNEGKASEASFYLILSGRPLNPMTAGTPLGTVTITLSEANELLTTYQRTYTVTNE